MSKFVLRPSASSRWLKCPSSAILETTAPATKSGSGFPHAAMGTAAHDMLEQCILSGRSPESFIGEKFEVSAEEGEDFGSSFIVDQEMADNIQLFLDAVEFGIPPYETVFPELHLTHSEVPELQGTSDYVEIIGSHGRVFDYKNGTAPVIARHRNGDFNTQLMCYTSLVFDKFQDLQTATIGIVQPRIKTKKKVRSAEVTRKDVDEFMLRVKSVAEEVRGMFEDNSLIKPVEGGYCWYCKASRICPTKIKSEIARDFA